MPIPGKGHHGARITNNFFFFYLYFSLILICYFSSILFLSPPFALQNFTSPSVVCVCVFIIKNNNNGDGKWRKCQVPMTIFQCPSSTWVPATKFLLFINGKRVKRRRRRRGAPVAERTVAAATVVVDDSSCCCARVYALPRDLSSHHYFKKNSYHQNAKVFNGKKMEGVSMAGQSRR